MSRLLGTEVTIVYIDGTSSTVVSSQPKERIVESLNTRLGAPGDECPSFLSLEGVEGEQILFNLDHVAEILVEQTILADSDAPITTTKGKKNAESH